MIYRLSVFAALLASASGLVVGRAPAVNARVTVQPTRTNYDPRMEQEAAPLTKIVATIGPASEELDTLSACVKAGCAHLDLDSGLAGPPLPRAHSRAPRPPSRAQS